MELSKAEKEAVRRYLQHLAPNNIRLMRGDHKRNPVEISLLGSNREDKMDIVWMLAYRHLNGGVYDPTQPEYEEVNIVVEGQPAEVHFMSPDLSGWKRNDDSEIYNETAVRCAMRREAVFLVYDVAREGALEETRRAWNSWTTLTYTEPNMKRTWTIFVVANTSRRNSLGDGPSMQEGRTFSDLIGATFLIMSADEDVGTTEADLRSIVSQILYKRAVKDGFADPSFHIRSNRQALNRIERQAVRRYMQHHNQNKAFATPVKIAVLGDSGIGKKSIISKFLSETRTIGPMRQDYDEAIITIEGYPIQVHMKEHDLNLYGCPSIEDMKRWSHRYHQSLVIAAIHSEARLLVYGVKFKDSLKHLRYAHTTWENNMMRLIAAKHRQGTTFVVANMVDIDKRHWRVSLAEGEKFSEELDAPFLQISAHRDTGVHHEDFERIVAQVLYQRAAVEGFDKPGVDEEPIQQAATRNGWVLFWRLLRGKNIEEPASQSHNETESGQVDSSHSSEFMKSFSPEWPK